ncbi:gtp-binding protein ypt1 [Anaeramoeba ignava]|uniref:Gtp-binding protein ypt1 n=1 Tax=Anaeramoeba ignava TaxID=1746090 RepID=A0A9Q0RDV0_ANAIG|nr:gtp-binding protein ypt1 [Anaeramoeba ignava]
MSFDHLFKVVIIGSANVGKTSLIKRYIDDDFIFSKKTTIGIDFKTKDVEIEGKIVRLQIWDTAGQEIYRNSISFSSSIYKNADIFMIVFDLTEEKSLNKIGSYLNEIENNCRTNPLIVIVGNKSDLIEKENGNVEERINEILKGREFKFVKTSAKDGTNVNELFYEIAKKLTEESQPNNPKKEEENSNIITLQNAENPNDTNKPQPQIKCC